MVIYIGKKTRLIPVIMIIIFHAGMINVRATALVYKALNDDASNLTMGENLERDVKNIYGDIPLYFVPNDGQFNDEALYMANTFRYTLWVTENGLIFDTKRGCGEENCEEIQNAKHGILKRFMRQGSSKVYLDNEIEREVSRFHLVNNNLNGLIIPLDETAHEVSYFVGNDRSRWKRGLSTYQSIIYKDIYRAIDLKLYGVGNEIEYDFIVKPGGNVGEITFQFEGVEETKINDNGEIIITTRLGQYVLGQPQCYQLVRGKVVEVFGIFNRISKNTYGILVDQYDGDYELVIDPIISLDYSTFLGGANNDMGYSIALDDTRAAYITGVTASTDYPTFTGYKKISSGGTDIFVTKLDVPGTSLVYSTYLGGSGSDLGYGITVDSSGNVYLTGYTESADFPTLNAYQKVYGGFFDAYVAKLDSTGTVMMYSTYLGGSLQDYGWDITVDSTGQAYVTGWTASVGFPTLNSYQGALNGLLDVFVTKLGVSGLSLSYSTFLGGSFYEYGLGLAVNTGGEVYVTGITESADYPTGNSFQGVPGGNTDAFVTKLDTSGTTLLHSSYLGGSGADWGYDLAIDQFDNAYITGYTDGLDFPTFNAYQGVLNGVTDLFITKVDYLGAGILFSTYLGGSAEDIGYSIGIDWTSSLFVTGYTYSADFPTSSALQGSLLGLKDSFVTRFTNSGTGLMYSTYLGGSSSDEGISIAIDTSGNAYITGKTTSIDFPTLNSFMGSDGGNWDGFVTKLHYLTPTPTPSPTLTPTVTWSATPVPTSTPSITLTHTPTMTSTIVPTWTSTLTPTFTPTPTLTTSPTFTNTPTVTPPPFDSFQFDLCAGLNMVSVPLDDPTIKNSSDLISSICAGNVDAIWVHDCTTDEFWSWTIFDTDLPWKVYPGMPLWVNVTKAGGCTWVSTGIMVVDMAYNLCPGLNMVSLPIYTTSITTASGLLSNIPACNSVFRWKRSVSCLNNTGFDRFFDISAPSEDFSVFQGYAYWVNTTAEGVWIPPNP